MNMVIGSVTSTDRVGVGQVGSGTVGSQFFLKF